MRGLIIAIFAWVVLLMVLDHFRVNYDDTDNYADRQRSGLVIYTDHRTGCQYLSRFLGGLTPRLDKNSEHIGCKS